jgi:hypothetical protein
MSGSPAWGPVLATTPVAPTSRAMAPPLWLAPATTNTTTTTFRKMRLTVYLTPVNPHTHNYQHHQLNRRPHSRSTHTSQGHASATPVTCLPRLAHLHMLWARIAACFGIVQGGSLASSNTTPTTRAYDGHPPHRLLTPPTSSACSATTKSKRPK